MKKKIIIYICFALLLCGCKEEKKLSCNFITIPYTQTIKSGAEYVSPNVVGYLFYTDSTKHMVSSYEEALRGEIISKTDNSIMKAEGTSVKSEDGSIVFSNLNRNLSFIVLCNPDLRMYAWRQLYVEAGVDNLYTKIRFREWKVNETYKEGGWIVRGPKTNITN